MAARLLILLCSAALASAEVHSVTPIEKVVTLLKKLQTGLEAEGAKEAAEYDKFACFCKEQADEKQYAIEKSDKKIGSLKAKIEATNKDMAALNQDITDLGKKVSALEGTIKTDSDKRATDLAAYQKTAKELSDAVSACKAAIEAMSESKDAIADGGGKVDLAQLSASSPLLAAALLAHVSNKQQPASFAYSSNDIVATLESLLAKFKANKVELDMTEFNAKASFDMKKQDMSNQKKFAEKESSEKEQDVEALGEALAEATEDKEDETKARTADSEFMKVLTADCELKATEWDQRSQTRSQEITAISKAVEDLSKNAMGNYEATGLTGLSQTKSAVKGKAAPSFLQIQRSPSKTSLLAQASGSSHMAATQKSDSPVLASLSMKLTVMQQSGIDHFVKVRQLIKDLLAKLKEDANSEATQKAYCDTNMKKQIENRDASLLTIEDKSAALTTANANLAETKQDIADLQEGIAANMKSLKESAELRAEAKEANELSLAMSKEGKASVEYALTVLKEFYTKAFLQEKAVYTPPNSGRDGKTVGDMAPKVFSGTYHGNQDASKGIIGILEVISADFQRTTDQVTKDDKQSETDYQEVKKSTEEDNDAKKKEVKTKEKKQSDLEDSIVTFTDDKIAAEKALETATATLDDLKKMCVDGEETYAERSAKRMEEIDALKEAMSILENWKD